MSAPMEILSAAFAANIALDDKAYQALVSKARTHTGKLFVETTTLLQDVFITSENKRKLYLILMECLSVEALGYKAVMQNSQADILWQLAQEARIQTKEIRANESAENYNTLAESYRAPKPAAILSFAVGDDDFTPLLEETISQDNVSDEISLSDLLQYTRANSANLTRTYFIYDIITASRSLPNAESFPSLIEGLSRIEHDEGNHNGKMPFQEEHHEGPSERGGAGFSDEDLQLAREKLENFDDRDTEVDPRNLAGTSVGVKGKHRLNHRHVVTGVYLRNAGLSSSLILDDAPQVSFRSNASFNEEAARQQFSSSSSAASAIVPPESSGDTPGQKTSSSDSSGAPVPLGSSRQGLLPPPAVPFSSQQRGGGNRRRFNRNQKQQPSSQPFFGKVSHEGSAGPLVVSAEDVDRIDALTSPRPRREDPSSSGSETQAGPSTPQIQSPAPAKGKAPSREKPANSEVPKVSKTSLRYILRILHIMFAEKLWEKTFNYVDLITLYDLLLRILQRAGIEKIYEKRIEGLLPLIQENISENKNTRYVSSYTELDEKKKNKPIITPIDLNVPETHTFYTRSGIQYTLEVLSDRSVRAKLTVGSPYNHEKGIYKKLNAVGKQKIRNEITKNAHLCSDKLDFIRAGSEEMKTGIGIALKVNGVHKKDVVAHAELYEILEGLAKEVSEEKLKLQVTEENVTQYSKRYFINGYSNKEDKNKVNKAAENKAKRKPYIDIIKREDTDTLRRLLLSALRDLAAGGNTHLEVPKRSILGLKL